MELGPGEDEAKLSTVEAAVDSLEVVDSDLRFTIGMVSVKVRKAVVLEYIVIVIPKKRLMVGTNP